ncbi:uncharacterized protein NFIA_033030 [Aspergillus fischeri NRRL 181]|uniref:Uncharacterized protein n=1 Tax=Neosartorya fischeri (strain ATCC 1020 / DSM 3700 / CBS 544.65 / FGSC A1164 / JCM 1740 / NRRL 181 / WB 181) TaxID=331117 RepID=A1CYB7_NEOFI|nr:uncharacterized protein NFIA_033030 [Aspergillus fischeri NRRL 181]EAW23737.1 hypothetical protein NFIA_033030 [Aspergillus fischeri NRRL 181]KAG2026610.1 hypothetical protein GB937_001393 [Aspergillus fischeri]
MRSIPPGSPAYSQYCTGDKVYDTFAASVEAVSCMGMVVVCSMPYAHPEVLHDITNGTNVGCGSGGFRVVRDATG